MPDGKKKEGKLSKDKETKHASTREKETPKGSKESLQESSIVSFDETTGLCVAKFILPEKYSKILNYNWTALPLTKETTTADIYDILIKKEKRLQSDEGMSLYEVGIQGSIKLKDTEHPFERCKKWMMHGTDKLNKFVLRSNVAHLKFYLASDIKSFWGFRVTGDTTAKEICDAVSERLNLGFKMYEALTGRRVENDAKVLFVYFSWKESKDRFILKSTGPWIPEKKEILPLDIGDEEVTATIGEINIPSEWIIDLSKLELHKAIGGGNFAKVYTASYKGEDVAVKKLLNTDTYEMQKYVQREVDLCTRLHHPNIVRFIGAIQKEKCVFLVTEFITKGDLRNLLSDEAMTLSWRLRVKMALDVARAVQYFLSQNFIHRDLKSQNLLVQPNFIVKLCDFGLARENVKRKGGHAKNMSIVGTDEWMAPEIILGEDYAEEADIFSYGMVLVELITREKPPQRYPQSCFDFPVDEFKQKVPEDCPAEFSELALDCVKYEPSQRPKIENILQRLVSLHASFGEFDEENQQYLVQSLSFSSIE